MKFISPILSGHASFGAKELYSQLNSLMGDGWQSKCAEIGRILVDLRRNLTALTDLISNFAEHKTWPTMNGAQSYFLYEGQNVVVRINLWFPVNAKNLAIDRLRKYLSIGELHNHDFDFFTICLLGPGYTTHFYRDKKYSADMQKGDRPDLERF